jgi:hypothetical protein
MRRFVHILSIVAFFSSFDPECTKHLKQCSKMPGFREIGSIKNPPFYSLLNQFTSIHVLRSLRYISVLYFNHQYFYEVASFNFSN